MKTTMTDRLAMLLNEDDAKYIAKTLGLYLDEVEITEHDLIEASKLHMDRIGYIPFKWSETIKVIILSDYADVDWFGAMEEMIASRKEVA